MSADGTSVDKPARCKISGKVGAAGIGRWAPRTAHHRVYMRTKGKNDVNIFSIDAIKGRIPVTA